MPNMNFTRVMPATYMPKDRSALYVIHGFNPRSDSDSIEFLNLKNESSVWEVLKVKIKPNFRYPYKKNVMFTNNQKKYVNGKLVEKIFEKPRFIEKQNDTFRC